jgi:hypothetical protein
VVTKLLSIDMRDGYVAEIAADYEKARPARQQEGRGAGDRWPPRAPMPPSWTTRRCRPEDSSASPC